MIKNILGTISICKKASKLIAGSDVVLTAIEDNKARLILASSDCSQKTLKPILQVAKNNGVAVMIIPCTKEELGVACSKSVCAVVAITDIGLANSLGKKLSQTSKENEEVSKVLDLKLKRKMERVERNADPLRERVKKPRPKKEEKPSFKNTKEPRKESEEKSSFKNKKEHKEFYNK
ncbi:MAG: ribosomal L7Ae/L30e/S12e/Gadd45 family protein [Clostridia bacterium]